MPKGLANRPRIIRVAEYVSLRADPPQIKVGRTRGGIFEGKKTGVQNRNG